MATNHGKHGDKTYHIQPNDVRLADCRILTLHHDISILYKLYSELRTARHANGIRRAKIGYFGKRLIFITMNFDALVKDFISSSNY